MKRFRPAALTALLVPLMFSACSGGSGGVVPSSPTGSARGVSPLSVGIKPSPSQRKVLAPPITGRTPSFTNAANKTLSSDADYGQWINPEITGADRAKAIYFMKMMPPNLRADFVYVDRNGTVLSNRLSLEREVRFKPFNLPNGRSNLSSGTRMPMAVPSTNDSSGPYVREYSQTGDSAALGYATISCGTTNLTPGDGAYMYTGTFDGNWTNFDSGLEYYNDKEIKSFVNVGHHYKQSGWVNPQTFQCGQHILVWSGVVSSQLGVLLTGLPVKDPTTTLVPPSTLRLATGTWNFFQLPTGFTATPATENGVLAQCGSCTEKRMTTIAFGFRNSYTSGDTSCFGGCFGVATNHWDQFVMGNLSQPCGSMAGPNFPNFTCTLWWTQSSWYGGIQKEPNAGVSGSFVPSVGDYNQYEEGINLGFLSVSSGQSLMRAQGDWHTYAPPFIPGPRPTIPPIRCPYANSRHNQSDFVMPCS